MPKTGYENIEQLWREISDKYGYSMATELYDHVEDFTGMFSVTSRLAVEVDGRRINPKTIFKTDFRCEEVKEYSEDRCYSYEVWTFEDVAVAVIQNYRYRGYDHHGKPLYLEKSIAFVITAKDGVKLKVIRERPYHISVFEDEEDDWFSRFDYPYEYERGIIKDGNLFSKVVNLVK